jgi:RNase P subunit RPR2
MAKILIIDIENAPMLSYIWKMYKENIGEKMLLRHSYMMSFACKWLGSSSVNYCETRTEDDSKLVAAALKYLDEADIVVAHNADRFDIPKLMTYAIKNNLKPPSPFHVVDTLKVAKKYFAFSRNTLEHIANYLGCSPKLKHQRFSGFDLWYECIRGNKEAWKEMKMYNIQDVLTLEEIYVKMLPFIKNHPSVSITQERREFVCPRCGSTNVIKRGYYTTQVGKYQRWYCKDCGGWSRSRYTELPKDVSKFLLKNI